MEKKISKMSMLTLGVADLERSTRFYEAVLATPPNTSFEGVTFIQLPGTWVSLFPLQKLTEDIASDLPAPRSGFSGITLAHNARSKADVEAILQQAGIAGGKILKPAQDTFWGGFSGYFADPDGYVWEVAWGPMFEFTESGDMQFKSG